jgi:simple sugar transport system ATP-binding protein/ribose transport system ATP-binding protein
MTTSDPADPGPPARGGNGPVHVELAGVSKRFGGVRALDDVSVAIEHGSIHGFVGENGAGKSTLNKIVAGVHRPDAGRLLVDGREVDYRAPHEALKDGITIIAQELALVPRRSVIENVFLGAENRRLGVVDRGALRRRFDALVERAGFEVPGESLAGDLRVADRQKVEILRALAREARLIVMDEPTAALSPDEAARLLDIIRALAAGGTTVTFVSHFLDQVLAVADAVTVMKDGRIVRTAPAAEESSESLITAMLGRSLELTFPDRQPAPADAPALLDVDGLSRGRVLHDVSLKVRAGEIVGLAGLIGSGRSEIARAIFGADPIDAGTIRIDGREVRIRSPRDAIGAGIAMLPESRKEQGLIMRRSVMENTTLVHLPDVSAGTVIHRAAEERRADAALRDAEVTTGRLRTRVGTLSGGNQQKALFAKWLFRRPRVLLADEPTRGVDVGAKRAIYDLIAGLAADGMAVLVISSELEEVLGLAHRVLVVRGGRIVAELSGEHATEEAVMTAAFGTRAAA